MTKEKAIKYLQQLYPNGGHCWLDEQRIEAIGMAIKALQEEPVGEDLEEKATQLSQKYFPDEENIWARPNIEALKCKSACIEMVEWLKAQKGE